MKGKIICNPWTFRVCLVGDQNLPRLTFGTVAAKESDVIKIKATPVARFDKKKKVYDM